MYCVFVSRQLWCWRFVIFQEKCNSQTSQSKVKKTVFYISLMLLYLVNKQHGASFSAPFIYYSLQVFDYWKYSFSCPACWKSNWWYFETWLLAFCWFTTYNVPKTARLYKLAVNWRSQLARNQQPKSCFYFQLWKLNDATNSFDINLYFNRMKLKTEPNDDLQR